MVQPGGDVQVSRLVDSHAVAAAAGGEIEDQPLAAGNSVFRQIESPDLSVASDDRTTVDDIERLFIRAQGDAIGTLDRRLRDDLRDRAVQVDAIHRFVRHLHRAAIAITRVGEKNLAVRACGDVVGGVVLRTFELIGQDFHAAVRHIRAGHAPPARRTEFVTFAGQQPALRVEQQAVGSSAVGSPDGRFAGAGVEPHDAVIEHVGKEDVSLGIGRGPLEKGD